jgi:CDP-glucose 4,6-dehydratase
VNQILKEMQSDLSPDIRNEVSNEIRHQYLSAEKARRDLKWKPMFNLDAGLQKTIAWYKDYFEHE